MSFNYKVNFIYIKPGKITIEKLLLYKALTTDKERKIEDLFIKT